MCAEMLIVCLQALVIVNRRNNGTRSADHRCLNVRNHRSSKSPVVVLEVRNPPRTVAGGPFVFIYVRCPEGHKHASGALNRSVSDACCCFSKKENDNQDSPISGVSGATLCFLSGHKFRQEEDSRLLNAYRQQ